MTNSHRQGVENRRQGRYDLSQPIHVRYRLFQEFIQQMSTNISTGGMFIATSEPLVVGEQFDFEFALEDGFSLVKGRAEVVWIRKEAESPKQPAGVGVRFVELEETGRVLIGKMVDKLRMKGQVPFDVERQGAPPARRRRVVAGSEPTPMGEAPPGQEQAGDIAAGTSRPGWLTRLTVVFLGSIVAGLALVLVFNLAFVRPKMDDLERRIEELSRPVVPDSSAAAADETLDVEALVVEEPPRDLTQPLDAVYAWADAWSEQRIDDYLAAYSPDFEPEGELTREEWERLRRSRILGGSRIKVQVVLAEEVELGPEERIVSFIQSYTSDTYHDRVRKVLRLVWQDDQWKIVEERVARELPY